MGYVRSARAQAAHARAKERMMKVLMVLTSHDQLGNTGRKTGFWLEEMAAPYYVFKDAGAEIVLASPKGGRPPLDPKSNEPKLPDRSNAPVRSRCSRKGAARFDRSPRQCQGRRLRHGFLPGRPRPDVGSGRRSELDQTDRIVPGRRQAYCPGLSRTRRASPRQDCGRQ